LQLVQERNAEGNMKKKGKGNELASSPFRAMKEKKGGERGLHGLLSTKIKKKREREKTQGEHGRKKREWEEKESPNLLCRLGKKKFLNFPVP